MVLHGRIQLSELSLAQLDSLAVKYTTASSSTDGHFTSSSSFSGDGKDSVGSDGFIEIKVSP